jgi:hypothetical protein
MSQIGEKLTKEKAGKNKLQPNSTRRLARFLPPLFVSDYWQNLGVGPGRN